MSTPIHRPLHTSKTNKHHYDEGAILAYEGTVLATARNPDVRRRLVACWNACHGLFTEDLETKGLTAAFGNQLLKVERQLLKVERQRDELLAALQYLAETTEEPPEPNCSCHINPPCSDCVEYGALREALEDAKRAIASVNKEAS